MHGIASGTLGKSVRVHQDQPQQRWHTR